MRGTGGNRFIEGDSDRAMILASIGRQLEELHVYAQETGRRLDVGRVTVDTQRVRGRISVTVTADLARIHNSDPGQLTTN